MASRPPVLRHLKTSYIFGRIPSLNVTILAVELLSLVRIIWHYGTQFASKPLLTSMVTASMLNAVADTVAQTITATQQRAVRQRAFAKKDGVSIEIHELNHTKKPPAGQLGELYASGLPFDFERLIRFMSWGFFMAPVQFKWFELLSEIFPIDEEHAWPGAIWRMVFDQVFMSPLSLALFFVFMAVAEGGGRRAVTRKFGIVFVSTMKSNYMVWPLVQILNFRVVPLYLQLPFASTIGICWNIYLSLKNDASEI